MRKSAKVHDDNTMKGNVYREDIFCIPLFNIETCFFNLHFFFFLRVCNNLV